MSRQISVWQHESGAWYAMLRTSEGKCLEYGPKVTFRGIIEQVVSDFPDWCMPPPCRHGVKNDLGWCERCRAEPEWDTDKMQATIMQLLERVEELEKDKRDDS